MSSPDLLVSAPPAAPLGSRDGTCAGKDLPARETTSGGWQVAVHDLVDRPAGHDGRLLLGRDRSTLADAFAPAGLG